MAFVKHTTVRENTDGRNIAEWSRNRRSDDYELLCNDGTRKDIDQWESCNMGKIPANAIVTAGRKKYFYEVPKISVIQSDIPDSRDSNTEHRCAGTFASLGLELAKWL